MAWKREIESMLAAIEQRVAALRDEVDSLGSRFAPASESDRLNLAFDELGGRAPISEVERLDKAFDELGRRAPISEVERLDKAFDELGRRAPISEVERLDKAFEELGSLGRDLETRAHASEVAELRELARTLDRLQAAQRAEMHLLVDGVERLLTGEAGWVDGTPSGTPLRDLRADPVYEVIEGAFRGSHEDIARRLRVYLPDIVATNVDGPVIDLGCGRGEWLAVLREEGIAAYGVDTNERFVTLCRDQGLDARLEEAIQHLGAAEEGSARAVTAFHLVEHVEFDLLIRLLDGALRVLAPGGCLIVETPNPENLRVGATTFYLDPTHRAPLPPPLLDLLVRQRGFADVEVRRLHPEEGGCFDLRRWHEGRDPELQRLEERLNDLLFGPMDYAVIARRPGR